MKIVAMLYAYPPQRWAGADIQNAAVLTALAAAGHEVEVWTTEKTGGYLRDDVRVMPNLATRRYPKTADLILTAPDCGSVGPSIAKALNIPLVGMVHNTGRRTGAYLKRWTWDLLVWNSDATREAFGAAPGLGMVVWPYLRLPAHATVGRAVTIASLSEAKGARIWWEMASRFPDQAFYGVLPPYGPPMLRPPGLETYLPNVNLLPTIPHQHVGELWAMSAIMLSPSGEESWGMANLEAMAHGVPVLAHPTPGVREALGDGGWLIDRSRERDWENAIRTLLTDEDRMADARYRARARAREVSLHSAEHLKRLVAQIGEMG